MKVDINMDTHFLLKSFYFYLKSQCLKLIPNIKENFLDKPEKILFVLTRYQSMFLRHEIYNIIETPTFKNCLNSISDKQILQKIDLLKKKLAIGDNSVLDSKKSKMERFVTANFNGFFDASGTAVTDFLLDTAQIMHFHIGYNKNTSDVLLFAYVSDNNIYFICIGSHKDLYVESGNSFVFDSFHKEFTIDANSLFPILRCQGISNNLDVKSAKDFKINAINAAFCDYEGNIRMPAINYAANRMPSYVVEYLININKEFNFLLCDENYVGKKFKIIALEMFNGKHAVMMRDVSIVSDLTVLTIYVNEKSYIAHIIDFLETSRKRINISDNSTISLIMSRAKSRKNIKRSGRKMVDTQSHRELLDAIVNRKPK